MDSPIRIDPEIMHGTPCFAGTRVPVKALFDLLARGRTVNYFVEQFPSVRQEQVLAVVATAGERSSTSVAEAAAER